MTRNKIAVCSWSLQPKGVEDLIENVRATGLAAVQLALDPLLNPSPEWQDSGRKLADAGIAVVSGMMGCEGEDYATIASIKETGGIMPDRTWPITLANMKRGAAVARQLGLSLVTFHAGFIPHDASSTEFAKGVTRVRDLASIFHDAGIGLAMETGQEPADALVEFLHALGAAGTAGSVGVNFDPANMILYGSGQPIAALKALLSHVKQVHIKDAVESSSAGEWGSEVPAGKGQVDWGGFFTTLNGTGYAGNFVIEREAGDSRVADVRTALQLLQRHFKAAD
jgi:L-ribulose-5-phosphate 3-epimerase